MEDVIANMELCPIVLSSSVNKKQVKKSVHYLLDWVCSTFEFQLFNVASNMWYLFLT